MMRHMGGSKFFIFSQNMLFTSAEDKRQTSSESRILKLFDALDFTSAMYQPSDHFRTLVQAQHRSRENLGAQYKRSQLHLRWRP